MASSNESTILLRVQLDEGKTEQRLQQLVLDLEATKKQQAELNATRKAGQVTDEQYALQSVALRNQLRAQSQEQTALTKNLELYRSATGELGNTYKGVQAQLSLAQRQFQQLDGSADNSTEATQILSKTIDELRGTLKATDEQQGAFFRNIGNYPKGEQLAPLIQQLVRLQEQQKLATVGSEEHQKATQQIGFVQQAAAQAGAQAGLSYEQTTAKIAAYGEAVRPVVQNLVQLEQEQLKVEEGSEAYTRIGFRMAALQKQVEAVPEETKKVSDTLVELDQQTGAFGGTVGQLKDRFNQAKEGVELARGSFTGLKGAIASTGIGVLILALGALFEYLTKTDEGAELLAAGMAGLKGAFSVLEGVVIGAGKALSLVFTDPKEAATQLVQFLENQVVNRVKSFGVIWNAIRNGDAKGLANGVIQFNTGVEDGIGKVQRLGAEMKRAAGVAFELSQANDKLEDDQRAALVLNEQQKNQIDKLILSAKDRNLTEQQRLANLDKASRLETEALNRTTALAKEKLRITEAENAEALRTGKISDEQRQAAAEAQVEVVRLAGQSATLQQSIANRRSVLLQTEAAQEKALRDKAAADAAKALELRLAQRREAFQLELLLLDRQLRSVQAGSDQELSILQRKLNIGRDIELAQAKLTVGQKKVIHAKYEAESFKLTVDFARLKSTAILSAESSRIAGELALARQGSQQAYELQRRQLETQLELDLAALDARKDNAAKEFELRAKLSANLKQLATDNAAAEVERQHKSLDEQAQLLSLGTERMLLGVSEGERRRIELSQGYLNARKAALLAERDALLAGTKEGSAERLRIEQETAAKLLALDEETAQKRIERIDSMYGRLSSIASNALSSLSALHDAQKGQELAADDARMKVQLQQAGNNAAAKERIEKQHAASKEKIEKEYAEKRRKLAIAQAFIDLGAAILQILRAPAAPFVEPFATVVRGIQIGLTSAAALAQISMMSSQKFADGTVLSGPRHEQGGIQLFHRHTGQHMGEAEDQEIILTRGVYQHPALRSMASQLNVLGGGRPLVPGRFMELGGVASASTPGLVRDSVLGNAADVAAATGAAVADSLRKSPPVVRVSDVKDGLERVAYTQAQTDA